MKEIIIPSYNLLLLPGVTYYFEKVFFKELASVEPEIGTKVIFLLLTEERGHRSLSDIDFLPIGLTGKITNIKSNGSVAIEVNDRVNVKRTINDEGEIVFGYTFRGHIRDGNRMEEHKRFLQLKKMLLNGIGSFPWAGMAKGIISGWKGIDEMMINISNYMKVSNGEKLEIMKIDSDAERFNKMEETIRTYLEIFFGNEGLDSEEESELDKFEKGIEESGMNETAEKEARKALRRMRKEGEHGHEYGMLYDYLTFMTGLSWKKEAYQPIDLKKAAKVLDEDHYGIQKTKDRVLQQLAEMILKQKQSGSILLFVGPPGTGKTSIGQSIAKACGRKYVRISLGGVKDEADIRGHRRTYIGALPGRIMDGISRSGVSNPVIVLDEVDKLSKSMNGDPASALLEVLDPEQNFSFTDHYMNVPYDLSDCLFICTANTLETIPEPLLNRMEVVKFQGYTESEKAQIAKKHLIPKAKEDVGIQPKQLKITDAAIHKIVAEYTMEAGVRGLKKRIATVCRKAAFKIVTGEQEGSLTVNPKNLKQFLDEKPMRHDSAMKNTMPGIVTGLAWTQAGGDILFIETALVDGGEKTVITGQLGDVMKESVRIAETVVKNVIPDSAKEFEKKELHVHVPAGAVPKDGPSAGITLTTALASLITGKAVSPEIAMTGEISLRGVVMPIGGLPEKLMAAVRAGIKKVLIPDSNVDDLEEVSDEVKSKLEIIPVHTIQEVLKITGVLE